MSAGRAYIQAREGHEKAEEEHRACLPAKPPLTFEQQVALSTSSPNLGVHIANRLVELGCDTAFAVPGDFNLLLLDQLLKHPSLRMVWNCNELNAGYAADGYARRKGIGCVVVTFSVGGFSVMNAVAGAMSEDLPLIVISGVPNSNDYASNRILHHTTGYPDFNQQLQAMREITCCQVTINHIEDAHRLIDEAISSALVRKKPAYIEVCCNLADMTHPSFTRPPVPYKLPGQHTNPHSCAAAVDAVAAVLDNAVKPVLLAGPRLRYGREREAFMQLAEASKYAVAIFPDAKGMVPEDHAHFIGLYWGPVSWPCVCEIVESADVVITVGCVYTDYTTAGYSLLLRPERTINVADHRVTVKGGATFGCITGEHFLRDLANRVKPNAAAFNAFHRMYLPQPLPPRQAPGEQLVTTVLFKHIQAMLTPETALIAEVGDSWFNSQKLRLPRGCLYEVQMRYGSIGWSVGATLGYAAACAPRLEDACLCLPAPAGTGAGPAAAGASTQAAKGPDGDAIAAAEGTAPRPPEAQEPSPPPASFGTATSAALEVQVPNGVERADGQDRRVVALIGDGSFQMTAQEVSTMLRYRLNPIIFLLNNASYTIEVQIHDNVYNSIWNWSYTALVEAMSNGKGNVWTAKVSTEEQLEQAIANATSPAHAEDCCFIEVILDRNDCSAELLEWGSRVGAANGRPPINT